MMKMVGGLEIPRRVTRGYNREILMELLCSRMAKGKPITWKTLVEVIKLNELAEAVNSFILRTYM